MSLDSLYQGSLMDIIQSEFLFSFIKADKLHEKTKTFTSAIKSLRFGEDLIKGALIIRIYIAYTLNYY